MFLIVCYFPCRQVEGGLLPSTMEVVETKLEAKQQGALLQWRAESEGEWLGAAGRL